MRIREKGSEKKGIICKTLRGVMKLEELYNHTDTVNELLAR